MSALKRLGIDPGKLQGNAAISTTQDQTRDTFAFKWARRDSYDSPAAAAAARAWLFERYCGGDPTRLAGWLAGEPQILLDAGCGASWSALLLFGDHLKQHDYLGVDISDAVAVARQRFAEKGYPGDFLQWDLQDLPLPEASVDLIFSEGVLHHTDSTETALRRLARHLKPGGRFLFYVYQRKGPIREFSDDYLREKLRPLSNAEAWEALKPLSRLGQALGELNVEIEVPEDIPLLGINRGRLSLQRFFYWNICKTFYRPDFTLEEMNHINFDWFRPQNCHRHTPEEVRGFCERAGLAIEHIDVQEAGITVVARRRA